MSFSYTFAVANWFNYLYNSLIHNGRIYVLFLHVVRRYKDIDTKINEQNEILMNLQRQKVWNNSQNAKLELEVEALQRQLAAFDKLESEVTWYHAQINFSCSLSDMNCMPFL